MAKFLAVILLLIGIYSGACLETRQESSFQEYIAHVPIRHTPLTFSFDEGHPEVVDMSGLDSDLVKRFTPPDMYLRGRIFPEREFVSLMYSYPGDVLCVFLFTYTAKGVPIDTAFITGEYMIDAGLKARSTTRILGEGVISMNDTLETVELNANDDPIPGTEKSTFREVRLRLDYSGKFVRVDSTGRRVHE
jgi:hypothetical protein